MKANFDCAYSLVTRECDTGSYDSNCPIHAGGVTRLRHLVLPHWFGCWQAQRETAPPNLQRQAASHS
jgi:hypothetical protein